MLKHRVITGVVLIAAFLGTLIFAAPPVFCVFTEIVLLWAAWEWTLLMGVKSKIYRFFYLALVAVLMQAIFWIPVPIAICEYFFYVDFAFWVAMIPLIMMYPRALFWKRSMLLQGLIGLFVLIPCWFAINFIRIENVHGQFLLLYLFVLVWC